MQCFKSVQRKIFNATVLKSELPPNLANAPKSVNDVQTVIIGAGLAGLSAANHLIKHGFKRTIIVEATNRYGGRINSKQFGDAYCELGAKYISVDISKNSIYELLRQAPGLPKQIEQKNNTLYVDTKGDKVVSKHIPNVVDVYFKKLCAGIELKNRYKKGNLHELDSVYTYFRAESEKIIKSMFKEDERKLVGDIFNGFMKEYGGKLGCNLENLNVEQLIKFKNQFAYPLYIPSGLDSILDEITTNIEDENLQIEKPVGEIKWYDPNKNLLKSVNCLDGTVIPADHIICTLPLGVLKNFSSYMFKPTLPPEKMQCIENIGFGSPVKIYFEYSKHIKSWFLSNFRPLWSAEERSADLKWTKQVVEISKLPSSNRVLEITIGGAFYDQIEKLPDKELADEITKLLRKCLKNSKIPFPSEILRSNWNSSACYLGGRPYFSTNSSVKDIQTLAIPLGMTPALLFAGDATIVNGFGTIDGARMSGIREAQRIIDYYTKNNSNTNF